MRSLMQATDALMGKLLGSANLTSEVRRATVAMRHADTIPRSIE
jgi:hypothetical protein